MNKLLLCELSMQKISKKSHGFRLLASQSQTLHSSIEISCLSASNFFDIAVLAVLHLWHVHHFGSLQLYRMVSKSCYIACAQGSFLNPRKHYHGECVRYWPAIDKSSFKQSQQKPELRPPQNMSRWNMMTKPYMLQSFRVLWTFCITCKHLFNFLHENIYSYHKACLTYLRDKFI